MLCVCVLCQSVSNHSIKNIAEIPNIIAINALPSSITVSKLDRLITSVLHRLKQRLAPSSTSSTSALRLYRLEWLMYGNCWRSSNGRWSWNGHRRSHLQNHKEDAQMRTHTYDFASFVQGELVRTDAREFPHWVTVIPGAMVGSVQVVHATVVTKAVPALSGATVAPSIDHAFDPVILMLQQMAFPVASIVLAWACLRAMIGHPAQGVDQAKWAIIGYLAMRYAPEILRHI